MLKLVINGVVLLRALDLFSVGQVQMHLAQCGEQQILQEAVLDSCQKCIQNLLVFTKSVTFCSFTSCILRI